MLICHDETCPPGSSSASDPDLVGLRRWLATDGKMGYCPEDYPLWVAAERCHCPPWELAKQGVWWKDRALVVRSAESYAKEEKEKHR